MHHLFGPYGTLSADNVERFRASEANAVWFHGFSAELFERCASVGASACVEFRTFRANFTENPHLCPTGADGRPIRYGNLVQGVCLSQTDFIRERESELREGLATFSPTGVWLDYLTYAGWFETPNPDLQESCFCPSCIAAFNEATGVDCSDPGEILTDHSEAWHRHKCDRIDSYARRFAGIIRDARPGTLVGLYACPWYPEEFDQALTRIFAQDLHRLAETFDVITPLMYAKKCGRPPECSPEYLETCDAFIPRDTPVAPIVDVLDFPYNLQALAGIAPYPSGTPSSGRAPGGIQVFGGDTIFADDDQTALFDASVRRIRTIDAG
jgi:hypothetical protein